MMYWIILQKNTPLTAVDTDLYWFIMFNLSKMNAYSFHILLVDLFKVECVLCKYFETCDQYIWKRFNSICSRLSTKISMI